MRKMYAPLLAILIVLTFCLPGIAAVSTAHGMQMMVETGSTVTTHNSPAMTAGESGQLIISEEKARESLNSMFPEIIPGKDLQAEYSEQGPMGKACWEFQSRNVRQQAGPRGLEIDALIDATTGEVVRMSYNPEPDLYRGKNVKLTSEQARQIAQEFLGKAQPAKVSQLTIGSNEQRYYYYRNGINMYYMFSWKRMANGVAVDSDNIYIGVNAVTGMVSHYTYNWHDYQFPQSDKTISKQELTAKLLNESGLCPSYVSVIGAAGNDINTLIPAYILNSSAAYYDCHTGQGLKNDGSKIASEDMRSYEQEFIPQQDVSVNGASLAARQKVNPEVAKKAAEEFFKFMGIKGEIQRSGGGSTNSGAGFNQEFWTYSISSENRYRDRDSIQVGVDIYTGKIIEFHQYNDQAGGSGKSVSYEEALNKATAAIQKINSEKKNLVVLHQQEWNGNDNETYSFNFARLVNGIPCEQEGIAVEIDQASGQLRSYRVNWYDAQYAPLTNIISPEKAREIYQAQEPFELAYVFPAQNLQVQANKSVQPTLVYRSLEKSRVDAISGEMLGWRIGDQSSTIPASFSGNWAAPALSLLNENGLLTDEIEPDGQMTRMQVLKILVRATGSQYYSDDQDIDLAFTDILGNDPDAKILQQAVKKAILPNQGNFEPDRIMSREDLAVWLVNSLGFQDVAAIKNRIETPFRDADQIAPDKANYVGVVEGLGLLGTDENKYFHPQAAITWAEMANVATRLATRTHAGY